MIVRTASKDEPHTVADAFRTNRSSVAAVYLVKPSECDPRRRGLCPSSLLQVVMQLQGGNTTIIPDTYRAQQISFINSQPATFNH